MHAIRPAHHILNLTDVVVVVVVVVVIVLN